MNKKIIILGFFGFAWLVFVFYSSQGYDFLNNKKVQTNEDRIVSEVDLLKYNPETNNSLAVFKEQKPEIERLPNSFKKNYFFEDIENNLCGDFPCYKGEEFLDLYNKFENNSGLIKRDLLIYDDYDADRYIEKIAKLRGYKKRTFARKSDIIDFEEIKTRKNVSDAYVRMRNEMKEQGMLLFFVSGYRSSLTQRNIFKNKIGEINISGILKGEYDEKIVEVLNISALPGYSKHHSGYAADFGCSNDYLVYSFAETECYEWMSANNFENTKRFGFIPSYPNGLSEQGPNPEPWEFVWVGVDYIK